MDSSDKISILENKIEVLEETIKELKFIIDKKFRLFSKFLNDQNALQKKIYLAERNVFEDFNTEFSLLPAESADNQTFGKSRFNSSKNSAPPSTSSVPRMFNDPPAINETNRENGIIASQNQRGKKRKLTQSTKPQKDKNEEENYEIITLNIKSESLDNEDSNNKVDENEGGDSGDDTDYDFEDGDGVAAEDSDQETKDHHIQTLNTTVPNSHFSADKVQKSGIEVQLSQGTEVMIDEAVLNWILTQPNNSFSKVIRNLMRALFKTEELMGRSLSGKVCNARGPMLKPKPPIDRQRRDAIIQFTEKKYGEDMDFKSKKKFNKKINEIIHDFIRYANRKYNNGK